VNAPLGIDDRGRRDERAHPLVPHIERERTLSTPLGS
jgi:hypothetical protein